MFYTAAPSRTEQTRGWCQCLRCVCKLFALHEQQPHFHLHQDVNTFAAATLIVKFDGNFLGMKYKLSALEIIPLIKSKPMAMGEAPVLWRELSAHSCSNQIHWLCGGMVRWVLFGSCLFSFGGDFFNQKYQKALKLWDHKSTYETTKALPDFSITNYKPALRRFFVYLSWILWAYPYLLSLCRCWEIFEQHHFKGSLALYNHFLKKHEFISENKRWISATSCVA